MNSLMGLIAHANLDLRFGPLTPLVVGPATHRVHHATGKNLGPSLLVWDHLFGTYQPPDAAVDDEVGVPFEPPTRFVGQLAWPVNCWLGYASSDAATARPHALTVLPEPRGPIERIA